MFRDQYRNFDRGSKKFKEKLMPTVSDLINYTNKEYKGTKEKS